jgi:EpsI family protein
MLVRIVIVSVCLLLGAAYIASSSRTEDVPPRTSLLAFPFEIGPWKGQTLPDFEPEVLAVLGVDEYLNRAYSADQGGDVGLYMGYYGSQRQGDTIHSPLNCLPGTGWQPLSHNYLTIPLRGAQSVRVKATGASSPTSTGASSSWCTTPSV